MKDARKMDQGHESEVATRDSLIEYAGLDSDFKRRVPMNSFKSLGNSRKMKKYAN
jgi:hypothetical protein